MAVLRKETRESYTVIDNAIFKDYKVSYKAKGLLCQMLSLPDGWEYSIEGLARLSNDGISAVRSALDELKEAGYFRREQVRENGRIAKIEYVISETKKCENLVVENLKQEILKQENQAQLNTYISNTKESITKSSSLRSEDIYSAENGKSKKFVKPSIEEIQAYINERGSNIDAEQFYDHYESNGWMVGKTHMKDWKASVRQWERNNYGKGKGTDVRAGDKDKGSPHRRDRDVAPPGFKF